MQHRGSKSFLMDRRDSIHFKRQTARNNQHFNFTIYNYRPILNCLYDYDPQIQFPRKCIQTNFI